MKQATYRHRKETLPKLSLSRLERLYALFSNKGWPIEEGIELSEFERYCHTLSRLEPNLQDFMIGLSRNFEHITVKDY